MVRGDATSTIRGLEGRRTCISVVEYDSRTPQSHLCTMYNSFPQNITPWQSHRLLHHSEIVSPLSFPLISNLPCYKDHISMIVMAQCWQIVQFANRNLGRSPSVCIHQIKTHIIFPEHVACNERHEASVHERDEGCARCPAEVPPSVFVQVWIK